ncbi:MAG: beta-lactamase family protein [Acidobacteria bacterium]|nr:beta-lactamase family protein [Acidobacteriota bacterium]
MYRRSFLAQAFSTRFLSPKWKSGPPAAYLNELTAVMKMASVPGAVIGSLSEGKPAWIMPLGFLTAEAKSPVTASTLFQAASLTKQVTAFAAFALRAQGKLDFAKPLVEYVDDLPNAMARTVTANHVLSHSSGFPNWRFAERGKPVPDLVPEFAPGTKYRYSGEGYFYLQRVMEQVTGLGFARLMRNLVFEPFGMASSMLTADPDLVSKTAAPHDRRGQLRKGWENAGRAMRSFAAKVGKPVEDLRYADYSAPARQAGDPVLPNGMSPNGAATMVTSAEDYSRFLAAAMKNPEIGKQQVSINDFLGWGLGWAVERAAGRTYLWQWGDNGGYKNFVLLEQATSSALFVFTNGDSGARVYDRIVTHATGHEHPALFFL